MTFEEVRAGFPVLERLAYLNAGTFGPLAQATTDAVQAELQTALLNGRCGAEYFERALRLRGELRATLAAFVGAEVDQVALTASTTDGCNLVVRGLRLASGDEIVTTDAEHFGLLGPLGVSGARVVVVPPDAERIAAAVTPQTKLLALSQVLWTTGETLPVAELRAACGVPVLADGAQPVGAIPVSLEGVDFLTISGQKWLCGPDATGALVVADPDALSITSPSYFAQAGYNDDGSFEPRPGAQRFDPNWWPVGAVSGLLTSIRARPAWAFARAAELADRCRGLLAPHAEVVTPEAHATLVAFRPDGEEPSAVVTRLERAGVIVREIPKTGLVRVSVGYWTSDDDLDRLVAALVAR
jgi:L-cysteine/cystine lyase